YTSGMKNSPIIAVLAAGVSLSLSACSTRGPEPVDPDALIHQNPPDPAVDTANGPGPRTAATPPPPTANPPPQVPITDPPLPPMNPPRQPPPLPSWEEVSSGHPAGATNPPMPVLIVTPDRRCFKDWV